MERPGPWDQAAPAGRARTGRLTVHSTIPGTAALTGHAAHSALPTRQSPTGPRPRSTLFTQLFAPATPTERPPARPGSRGRCSLNPATQPRHSLSNPRHSRVHRALHAQPHNPTATLSSHRHSRARSAPCSLNPATQPRHSLSNPRHSRVHRALHAQPHNPTATLSSHRHGQARSAPCSLTPRPSHTTQQPLARPRPRGALLALPRAQPRHSTITGTAGLAGRPAHPPRNPATPRSSPRHSRARGALLTQPLEAHSAATGTAGLARHLAHSPRDPTTPLSSHRHGRVREAPCSLYPAPSHTTQQSPAQPGSQGTLLTHPATQPHHGAAPGTAGLAGPCSLSPSKPTQQ